MTSRGICARIRYGGWKHIVPTLEPHLLILVVQVDDLAHKAALGVLRAGRHPLLACGAVTDHISMPAPLCTASLLVQQVLTPAVAWQNPAMCGW